MIDKDKNSLVGQVTLFQLLQLMIPMGCASGGFLVCSPFGTAWSIAGAVLGLLLGGLFAWIGVFYLAVWCSKTGSIQPRTSHEASLFLSQVVKRPPKDKG